MKVFLNNLLNWFEKYLVALVIGGFVLGIIGAALSTEFIDGVNFGIGAFMDLYAWIAPFAIFFVLAPSLAKLLSSRESGAFTLFVVRWLAVRKILACLWAIVFISIVLRLPLFPEHATSTGEAVIQTLKSLGKMALTSPYFWAMYAAVIAAFIARKNKKLFNVFDNIMNGIEAGARGIMPVMPLFMLAIGAYIYGLPANVAEQVGLSSDGSSILNPLSIWGWNIDPTNATGMIMIYVIGALLTAIACMIWHMTLLWMTAKKEKRFTIKGYFKEYWIKVYPLLWATSSEALAMPYNLYLTKKYFPWVSGSVRRLVVGMGSYMNINGTIINVFVLGGIVLSILGQGTSVLELLFIIPIVFFISYGVPGIPGELILFAGPMATLLNLSSEITPIFLAIYIGIQIGLSDSFRTGNNSTDNSIAAVYMNAIYNERFTVSEAPTAKA